MENYVSHGHVKLWTAISGKNKDNSIMLCNGGPGCADYLEPVAHMLDDKFSVIRFEQRACGRSSLDYNCDVKSNILDLECIRQHYGIDHWIVGGHSWGANLALAYALAHPDKTNALLYISGNGIQRNREWSVEYKRNKEELGEEEPQIKYPGNGRVNQLGNQSWQTYIQQPMLLKKISELRIPALFVYGQKDIRPSWPAKQIAALMPNARFYEITGAAHYIWLTHSEELESILREFVLTL